MPGRVEGKVAFITGAARGQGRSHAVRLAQEGADIIAVDLATQVASSTYATATPDDLDQTVREVEATGRRIVARYADVRDVDALRDAVNAGIAEFGRLDIVSANAGFGRVDDILALSDQSWQDQIDVNLTGQWNTVKVSVPHIIAGGRGGAIVLTGSVSGLKADTEDMLPYVAAKHGVAGLMKGLGLALGKHSIRVNTVNTTAVATPMLFNDTNLRLFRPDLENPTIEDMIEPSLGMHVLPVPWVEPIDVSNALLFLVSDEARYITGVQFPVDAGNMLK